MPDYQELYLKMVRASEQAVNLLIAAQQECEELYISAQEPELKVLSRQAEHKPGLEEESG